MGNLTKGNYFHLDETIQSKSGELFELDEWIGRGGNATVFKARHLTSGFDVAIKFLIKNKTKNKKRFIREIQVLKELQGDHITQFLGEGEVKAINNKTKRPVKLHFVVLELAECNLASKMKDEPGNKVPYLEYSGQFRGLASALADLHMNKRVIHRDIKPENILVVGQRWLLSDFGLCTSFRMNREDLTQEKENIGPKYWLSPEAHNRRLGCNDSICEASDVFQLAAIFWYVVTGRQPSGIVTEKDWTGPNKLFDCLHRSLYHNHRLRPQNGKDFFDELEVALIQ